MSRNPIILKPILCLLLMIVTAAVGVFVGYNQHGSHLEADSLELRMSASEQLTSPVATDINNSSSVSNDALLSNFSANDSNADTPNPLAPVNVPESEDSSLNPSGDISIIIEETSNEATTPYRISIATDDLDTSKSSLIYIPDTSLPNVESSHVTAFEIDETEGIWSLTDFVATELTSIKEGSTVIIHDPHGQEITRYTLGDFLMNAPLIRASKEITAISLNSTSGPVLVTTYDSFGRVTKNFTCDGIDDQEEINLAIDALAGKEGRVHLSVGVFYISSPILTQENLILEGSDYDTLLHLTNESNCDVISSVGGPYNPVPNVTIRNLRIDGNKDNQFKSSPPSDEWRDGHGIYRTGGDSIYENLWIENIYRRGIVGHGGSNTKIRNNVLRDCDEVGIALSEVVDGEISGNELYNCGSRLVELPITSNRGSAIAVYSGKGNKVLSNYINGGGYIRQICGYNSDHLEISSNVCLNGMFHGIGSDSDYARITNNIVANCSDNAIDTWSGNDNWVEGNFVSGAYGPSRNGYYKEHTGICLNTSRTTCIDNIIEFAGKAGIHLVSGNNDNEIIGNTIRNCGLEGGWPANGIWIQSYTAGDGISGTNIRGNKIYDNQRVPTQQFGIYLSAQPGFISDTVIEDNDLRNNGTAGINNPQSSRIHNITIKDDLA